MNDCYSSFLKLSSFDLYPFISQYQLSITQGREYTPISYIAGNINLVNHQSISVYSSNCFSLECFSQSGIWSSKPFIDKRDSYNCMQSGYEECYEEYTPICSIKNPYDEPLVYQDDVFNEGIYQTLPLYRYEYERDLCYLDNEYISHIPPFIASLKEIFDISPYPVTNAIYNKYTLNQDFSINLFPYESDIYEEDVYTFTTFTYPKGIELVVSIDSPYQPFVYSNTYSYSHHVSLYNPSKCFDDCTFEPLAPLVIYKEDRDKLTLDMIYNCISDYPSQTIYSTKEGVNILVSKGNCIDNYSYEGTYERTVMYFNMSYFPYESDVYEEGIYVDMTLMNSYPLYIFHQPSFCCPYIDNINPLAFLSASLNHYLTKVNEAPNSIYYPRLNHQRKPIVDCTGCYKPRVHYIDGMDRLTRLNGDKQEVFYTGLFSSLGLLVMDIGYIYPKKSYGKYEFTILKKDIPINVDGTYGVNIDIPLGIKAIRLKAITPNREIFLGMVLGDNPISPLLIKTFFKPTFDINLKNIVNIEDLSLSIILISLSGYKNKESDKCGISSSHSYYLDPYLRKVLSDNLLKISKLINIDKGYLPSVVLNDSTYESLYIDRVIERSSYYKGVYEAECDLPYDDKSLIDDKFECVDKCFEDDYYLLPSLASMNLRYISWLCISYIVYSTVFPQDPDIDVYIKTIDILGNIILNNYKKHELLDKEKTSTNIMVCIALLKLYEFTHRPIYLNRAADLYQAINDYLYVFNDNYFLHDINNGYDSIESNIYGLIFSIWTNQEDKIEFILKNFILKKKSFIDKYRVMIYQDDEVITTLSGESIHIYHTDTISIIKDGYKNVFIPFYTLAEDVYELDESIRLFTLLNISLNTLKSDNYNVFNYKEHFKRYIESINEDIYTSTWLSFCMNPNISLNDSLLKPNVIKDLETLIFNRKYIIKQLNHMIPTGFGWFHEKSLSKSSNLGRLLRSVTYNVSVFYPYLMNILNSFSLTSSNSYKNINKWEDELDMGRWEGERYEEYKERVKDYLLNKEINIEGIFKLLHLYQIKVFNVEDIKVQSLDSYISYNQSSLCSTLNGNSEYNNCILADIQGLNIPSVFIEVNKPVLDVISKEVKRLTPVGVKVFYKERLDYISCLDKEDDVSKGIFSINIPTSIPYLVDVSPTCCTKEDVNCGYITYKLTLSHISSSILYLYYSDGFYITDRVEMGMEVITKIDRYNKQKIFLWRSI